MDWKLNISRRAFRASNTSSHSLGNQWIGNSLCLGARFAVFLPTRWEISGLETLGVVIGVSSSSKIFPLAGKSVDWKPKKIWIGQVNSVFPLAGKSVDWKLRRRRGGPRSCTLPTRWEISGLETITRPLYPARLLVFPLAGKSVDWKQ